MSSHTFTLGVEEEYAIVDPESRELKSHINTMLAPTGGRRRIQQDPPMQPELHQSVVEVATPVCTDIHDARRDIINLRRTVIGKAESTGAAIAACATHPFSDWKDQDITERPRYIQIVDDLQDIARGNLIFGLHIHVGVPSPDAAVEVMNEARYFLPHLLALSTSSPFWLGRRSGLMSSRCGVFRRFPRTGIPAYFESSAALTEFIQTLVDTGCIENASKIWWDLRAHHLYPTVEFRICDLPTRVEDTLCLVALTQAIVCRLRRLRAENMGWRRYQRGLIEENKWRAMRHGVNGKLLDLGTGQEVEFGRLIDDLLAFIDPVLDELGSRKEAEHVLKILADGTSADRQLRVFTETGGDLKAVVDHIVAETREGVFDEA